MTKNNTLSQEEKRRLADEIMTTQDVAAELDMTRATVCKFARLGLLKPFKNTANGYLFYREDIKAFLLAQANKTALKK